MRYRIELEFGVSAGHPELLDTHLDELMDALVEEPGAEHADLTAELATGKVVINMYVEAVAGEYAVQQAMLVSRSAIHRAGGFTGGWTEHADGVLPVRDDYDLRVQPVRTVDC